MSLKLTLDQKIAADKGAARAEIESRKASREAAGVSFPITTRATTSVYERTYKQMYGHCEDAPCCGCC